MTPHATKPEPDSGMRSRGALLAALWIAQVVFAGVFAAAGALKLSTPLSEATSMFAWTSSVPPPLVGPLVKLAAVVELGAALAAVLPSWSTFVAELSRQAVWGAALLTTSETALLVGHRNTSAFLTSVVLCALAAFVAWGRGRFPVRSPEGST